MEEEKHVRMPGRAQSGVHGEGGRDWSIRVEGSVRDDDVQVKFAHGNASHAAGHLGLR